MTERGELEALIYRARWVDGIKDAAIISDQGLSEVILDDGYRKPRLIKTAAELDRLPLRSVVLDGVGNPWKRADDGTWWCGPYSDQTTPMLALLGPVLVISDGSEVGG